ncbi:UbiA family prenyltransferase [Plantactinospora sp. GCM10030261]|uniref:UbiA family prenyltransferase n=1 Tax=Plantactinospora sp. GCM10030261 TaxID=3273420 RepID=UPI00360EE3A4
MARLADNGQTSRVSRQLWNRRTLGGLIRASHPEPAAAVTAVAVLLAAGAGHRPGGLLGVGTTVLASQLAVGWSNDWLDADRDALVGRRDKPVPAGLVDRRRLGGATLVAIAATPILALSLTPLAALCSVVALGSALLYNWPLKSTPFSVLPYAVSFGALPACVVLALPGSPTPPAWLPAAGALLGAGAHFANALPDLADDARTGIHGLPHRLGPTRSRLAAGALLLAATAVLVFGPPGPPSWAGWAATAIAVVVLPAGWYVGADARRPVATFRAVMLVAVLDVVLLVLAGRLT